MSLDLRGVNVPSLRQLQLLVWELIVAPEGARQGLEELVARGSLGRGQADAWFAGDERRSAIDRVDVYANMYFYRLKDALREDFPSLVKVLGEARYHNLITDYLLAHPSSHYSLRYAGQSLPRFLAAHEIAEHPWAADLAALEWARADAFQAVDAATLSPATLAVVPPEAWGELRFEPVAHVHLVRASWDVAGLWERLSRVSRPEDGKSSTPAPGEAPVPRVDQAILVYRQDELARHAVLDAGAAVALEGLLARHTFGEICERLAGPEKNPEKSLDESVQGAAERAAKELMGWLDLGLLAGFTRG